jgi:hypothetical protein
LTQTGDESRLRAPFKEGVMTGKRCLRDLGVVVFASLLSAPAAQAASWWSLSSWSRVEEGDSLGDLWQRITGIFQTDDGDNRGTIDPNG